jgi:hypothetical protein
MNKIFLSLLLAVCVLGMVLIMLNERLRKPDQTPAPTTVLEPAPPVDATPVPPPAVSSVETPPVPDPVPTPAPSDIRPPAAPPAENSAMREPQLPVGVAPVPQPSTPAGGEQVRPVPPSAPAAKSETSMPEVTARPETAKPAARPEATSRREPSAAGAAGSGKEKAAAPQQRTITKFVVFAREKGATVRLAGTAPISYKSMELANPDRMVVDLEGAWQIKAPGVPKNAVVTNVRLGREGKKTRIVIDLSQKARSRFILSQDRMTLDIRLDQ